MVSMYRCRAHVGEHEASVEAPGNLADSSRFHQQNIILIRRELTGQFRSHSASGPDVPFGEIISDPVLFCFGEHVRACWREFLRDPNKRLI